MASGSAVSAIPTATVVLVAEPNRLRSKIAEPKRVVFCRSFLKNRQIGSGAFLKGSCIKGHVLQFFSLNGLHWNCK